MEAVISILMYVIGLFILYLVITVAVRHGIDNSETGKAILTRYNKSRDNRYNDVDKD
ncbi:hypothetical protein GCM10009001_08500 [Virgibacillus siamensis]|uniref:Uncharacterized protein n=1 Tax=Virgibacillus siamensis TaxID=480071 RepID=A0ABP3QRN0_9BACI